MRETATRRKPKPAAIAQAPVEEPSKDSREILFPREKEVQLSDGSRVIIRKWSIATLTEVSRRLPERMTEIFSGKEDAFLATLVPECTDELAHLVSISCAGLTREQILEEWAAEDLLDVANQVFDHCIIPIQGKIASLVMRFMAMAPGIQATIPTMTPEPHSPQPSNSSSQAGTPSKP